MEETLFTKVTVEEGEEDEREPDDQNQPELLVRGHLVPNRARLHVRRPELCAFHNPLTEVPDHGIVVHFEDKIRTVDDSSHSELRGLQLR